VLLPGKSHSSNIFGAVSLETSGKDLSYVHTGCSNSFYPEFLVTQLIFIYYSK